MRAVARRAAIGRLAIALSIGAGFAAAGAGAWAQIEGEVVNSHGVAVEAAQVVVTPLHGTVVKAATDSGGLFRIDAEPPLTLEVTHPRYERIEQELMAPPPGPLLFELVPKQALYEELAVAASRGGGDSPVSLTATAILPEDLPAPPSTLGDLVSSVSGVSENGQGGLFQAYSIRGISRQRIQTMVAGARIVGERRAGVSASFIDPELLDSVQVLRGPASSYYGSGALGGVIQALPRTYESLRVSAGYESQGEAHHESVGWGSDGWSLAVAQRRAGNAETPDGEDLNSGFEQYNAMLEREWTSGPLAYRVQAIATAGRDIGKSNTDFPEEVSSYPSEDHLLLRFAVQRPGSFQVEAYVHPNALETRVDDVASGDRAEVFNEAFDFGGYWQKELAFLDRGSARVGVDWFGRREVTAREEDRPALGPPTSQSTLHDGEEDEGGIYGASEWSAGRATILVGGRFAWQRQANDGGRSAEDSAWTGFAGVVAPLGRGFEVAAHLGTGQRFASLSERFFAGATGRGQVLGNPNLDSERSLAFDLGLRYYGRRLFVTGSVYRTEIDDYIERITVSPDLRTFVNLTEGTLEGAELTAHLLMERGWTLDLGAHTIDGEDGDGGPLADVPADRVYGGAGWLGERWGLDGRWEHRWAKADPGSGEKAILAANVVSLAVSYAWRDDLTLRATARNLLDEEYFNSADEQVPLSAGRSLGVSLTYEP
jgi:outer membrane receptor protein involved in Fe transport